MSGDILYDFGFSRVVSRGEELVVQMKAGDGWREITRYHRISDDYAFTNARERAERLAKSCTDPAALQSTGAP